MNARIVAVLLLALALAGCGIQVPDDKLDYVGHWRGPDMTLVILRDGTVDYERSQGNVSTALNSPLKEFVGDDFVVGVLFFTTTFEVTEPPHEVDGRWQMVVDGVRLTRLRE